MNEIKSFSLNIAADILEDIQAKKRILLISNSNCNQRFSEETLIVSDSKFVYEQFDTIVSDLTLELLQNTVHELNIYKQLLTKNGILIATVLSGKTLYELTNAMLQTDLLENRVVTRMLPRLSADVFLNIAKQSNFKNLAVMTNELRLQYSSVRNLIHSLRQIGLTTQISHSQPTSKQYWQSVEQIYQKLYNGTASFEFFTLFTINHF